MDDDFVDIDKAYSKQMSATRRMETRRKFLRSRITTISLELAHVEELMGLEERWTPTLADYQAAVKLRNEREYWKRLNHLHKLIVQRLFEPHKMNLAGTGT